MNLDGEKIDGEREGGAVLRQYLEETGMGKGSVKRYNKF